MFATHDFTPRTSQKKDTLIPLVLALAIAVAGLVEPDKSALSLGGLADSFTPVSHTVDDSTKAPQRITK